MPRLSTTSNLKTCWKVVRTAGFLLCTAAAALAGRAASAQTWSTNPGSNDYNTGSNWSGGQVPAGTATFGSSTTTTLTNSQAITVGGFTFNSGAPAYTFNLSNSLTFNGAGIADASTVPGLSSSAPSFIVNSGATLTFGGGTKPGDSSLTVNSGGSLVFQGNTINTNGRTLVNNGTLDISGVTSGGVGFDTVSGSGNLVLGNQSLGINNNSDVTISGVISGTGVAGQGQPALFKQGTGTLTLSGANTFTTGIDLFGGTLSISSPSNLGIAGGLGSGSGVGSAAGYVYVGSTSTVLFTGGGTYPNLFQIVTGSALNVAAGQTVTLTGEVEGGFSSGLLTKTGSGTLVLASPINSQGGNLVSAGTLRISGSGTLGQDAATTVNGGTLDLGGTTQRQDGGVTLVSGTIQNGTLTSYVATFPISINGFFNVQSGTVSAVLAGSAALTKTSAGTVILDGANTYTGGTTVTGGILQIGDANPSASVAGPVAVTAGGTLTGIGTIGGSLVNSGVVSPGPPMVTGPVGSSQFSNGFFLNQVILNGGGGGSGGTNNASGTLSVGGNYVQASTGTLLIIVSPTATRKLAVGGAASLSGTLNLAYNSGTYTPGSVYQILTAGGGVSGTFGAVTTSNQPLGVSAMASYLPNEVDVTLTSTGSGSFTSGLSAQGAVLSSASLAGQTLFQHLDQVGQGTDGVFTATASSSPVQVAFAGGAEELSAVLAQVPDTFAQYGGWFRATGTFANVNNQGSIAGYHSSAGAFLAGFDRQIAPNLMAGIAAGYGHSSASIHDDGGSSETIDTPRGFVYGRYSFPTMYVDGSLGYAYDTFNLTRPVTNTGTTASSRHDGQEVSFALQAGRPIALGWATLTPKLGFQYVHLSENGYTESGAGANDLTVAGHDTNSLRPQVGTSLDRQFTTDDGTRIVPEARVSYSRELLDVTHEVVEQDASSTPTTVVGLNPARNIVGIGTGVAIAASTRLSLFADYDADLSPGSATVQTVSAGIRLHF